MEMAVTMTGNVGSDIEHRVTRTGLATASFRMACTPRVYREGEWHDQTTTWIGVECFRGLADNVSSSLGKGEPIIVQGRLLSLIHISKPTRLGMISYAVFCLKKKNDYIIQKLFAFKFIFYPHLRANETRH